MEPPTIHMNEVFIDTAFAIALSSPKDANHQKAVEISERLELEAARLVTTRAVIIEIANALSKQAFRSAAIDLIESLEQDPQAEIIRSQKSCAAVLSSCIRSGETRIGD